MKKLLILAAALFATTTFAAPGNGSTPKIAIANASGISTTETNVVVFAKLENADAKTTKFQWEQLSGPTQAVLEGANRPTLLAHRLRAGSYTFTITASTPGGTTSQEVTVNVLAGMGDQLNGTN